MKKKRKNQRRKKKQSKLGSGTWHFWFLHSVTLLGFVIGYLIGGLSAAFSLGVLMYVSPYLASYQMRLSKAELSRFYKPEHKG